MSSSNNNKKKNDEGESKKKEPTDTLDVKKPPALSTHCDEEVSSFPVEKRLNAERSRATMQMEKKLAPTSSEKEDQDSSRYAISANMSDSDILTLQDLQNSMNKSSYAAAATPATAGQYHAHPFAEEAKEDELEEATLLEYLAAVPKVSKKSVDYSNETNFAKAANAKVEQQDQEANTLNEIPVVPHEDNHTSGIFVTEFSSKVLAHEVLATQPPPQQALPGAFPVQGIGTSSQNNSYVNGNVDFDTNDGQLEHATLFNAELVIDPELASASVVDFEAEERAQCKRQVRNALVLFLVIGLLVTIIATPIQVRKKKKNITTEATMPPSASHIPSMTPSKIPTRSPTMTPSEIPSQSPSSNLFGFLAVNSFDNGAALEIPGTSQERAMSWLETELLPNHQSTEMDFNLLQFYVLAVIYFEAVGKTWLSTLSQSNEFVFSEKWLKQNNEIYDFCYWKGIGCSGTVITSLQLSGEGLLGSIPPEIAVLREKLNHIDLSNNTIFDLPLTFRQLSNLVYFNCSANFIEVLPSIFGNMTNLSALDFGDNAFLSGNISSNWPQLTRLRHLNFGHGDHQIRNGNDLTGKIPTELGLLSSLTFLSLGPNRLTGKLPTESGLLTNLFSLSLSNNKFFGTLPTEIWNLTSLNYLDLSNNKFSGTLPTAIGLLISLTGLYLSNNKFFGTLPTEIWNLTSLTDLYLSNNKFSGTLPTEIGLLTSLTGLYLSNNKFFGTLPTEIWNLTSLTDLYLSNNKFSGTLPTEIGLLTSLNYLDLSVNTFNGTLPTAIGLLTSLKYLDLYDNTITGTLPTEIGLLTSLTDLDLSLTIFNGTLPTEIGLLTSLNYLHLSSNFFNGTLPTAIGLLISLTGLSLYETTFTGTLPTEIGLLTSLMYLDLSPTTFTGTLPTEIGLLTSLNYLFFSNTTFTGTLPTEIGLLTSLIDLYLSYTTFTGTLPTEIGLLTSLTGLDLSSTTFTGTLPTEIGLLTSLTGLDLSSTTFNGTLPTEIGLLTRLFIIS